MPQSADGTAKGGAERVWHPPPRSIFKVASKFATHLLVTVQLGQFVDALDPIVPSPSAFPVTTSVTVPSPVVVVVAAPAVPKVAPAPTPASAPPAAPVPAPAPVPTAVPRVHPIRDRHLHRPNSLTASRPLSPKPRASLFPTQHPPRLPPASRTSFLSQDFLHFSAGTLKIALPVHSFAGAVRRRLEPGV